MYNLEVWSILWEQDTCAASVKDLEEVLAVEELMDKEVEMRKEKAQYDAKRALTVKENMGMGVEEEEDVGESEGESESEEEEDEEEDEPVCSSGLLAKAKGKQPAK